MKLPAPEAHAQVASRQLVRLIADDITRQGGWISFAHYMALALYTPTLGYYAGGAVKLGREGDFTTAPEISPLFGETVAQPVASLLKQSRLQVLEFGAGSGKLARDMLTELARMGITVDRYDILELSGELRARQQAHLKDFPQVAWIETLPPSFSGVIVANEVLDAMPVNLVKKENGTWCEVGVALEKEAFVFSSRPCSDALRAYIAAHLPQAATLTEGYLTEVPLQALAFMRTLSDMLARGEGGAALLMDYGFPAREYYLNQRCHGTLMCHYRHHAHSDPFFYPGLQDITSHLDFTALARTASEAGLDVLAYLNQAAFLMASGIGERLLRLSPDDAARYLPQASAVQTLLSPTEMGELFKTLIVGHRVSLPASLARADRSERL